MEINSLQQWFIHCENNHSFVKEYEDNIEKFYDQLYKYDDNKEINIGNILAKPLMQQFYTKEIKSYNKHIQNLIKKNIVLIICILILTFLAFSGIFAFSAFKVNHEIKDLLSGFLDKLVLSIIISLVITTIFVVLLVVLKKNILKSICKKLKAQETELTEILECIPPIYRSSEKMSTLFMVYSKYPNISITQAFDVCDEYIRENRQSNITSVMFDLPYHNSLINENRSNIIEEKQPNNNEEAEEKPKNPALPADIDSYVFSGSEDAQKDLNAMIGLESVKQQIDKLRNRISFYGSSDVGGGGNHMVFMGSAGTGKTTVARIITKILYDFGFITKNQCIEVSGNYLKSPYTGQTGERTQAIVDYAIGGVLFIDEAYLLYDNSSASSEATGVLLKAMEDHRKDFVCILAGYEEQITKLLASNEGFNSRIKYKIYFTDYTKEEMYEIFTYFINHYNGNQIYLVEDQAKDLLLKTFELEKRSKSFGNARTVRNAVDAIMDNYADRCIRESTKDNLIKYPDVELYYKSRANELQHEIRNSSANNQLDESIIRLSELKQKVMLGSENPNEDIKKLVGLDDFKNEMITLKNQKEFYGDNFNSKQQNILLIGPNGCGKSSLAKVLTGYLYQYGYIQDNRYLNISAEFLKGSYVGHTAKRADAIINYAAGGVLFIKNLNSLVGNNSDSFSQEVISVIMNALNSNNNIVIVIADSYSNFIESIKNMFSITYTFPNYTENQLVQVFFNKATEDQFSISQGVFNILAKYINTNKITSVRDVIRIYELIKKNHINNYTGGDNKFIIDENDIITSLSLQPPTQQSIQKPTKIKINLSGTN